MEECPHTLEMILTRAMSDKKFADLLFSDLEKALADYKLAQEDLDRLKGMTRLEFDQYAAASPDDRKSYSGASISPRV
jgi:hypothetical protein